MQFKNKNGVLGLDTVKQVLVTFLILAVTGVAVILSLTSIQTGVGNTIDNQLNGVTVINESDYTGSIVFANRTGYTLSGFNTSWSGIIITAVWNSSQYGAGNGGYNITVPTTNVSASTLGVLSNATNSEYANISASYTYTFTFDTQRTDNIIGNVSGGLVTFFASTGTIFSILVVVVIILAISIIIWAVGRFGQQTEGTVNL